MTYWTRFSTKSTTTVWHVAESGWHPTGSISPVGISSASAWNDILADADYERCRYIDDDDDALAAALADPLMLDAVLFEGGAFEEFLEVRGSLLPDDERLLAERWLLVERSVFEVEQVRRGQGVTVRDVRTGDTREAAELAKQMPVASEDTLDPDDPEVAAFLDEFVRDYETKWLDEPIPALDGHTPRQAADDPTRRADLIKLLDTFPAVEAGSVGMDPERLRDALGLR
jgi:hypothetical protein